MTSAKRFSKEWFEALKTERFCGEWSTERGPKLPTHPWVTPPLHPVLRAYFDRFAEEQRLLPEKQFFPTTQVTHFVLVREGLTARIASTFDGQPGAGAMALSPPNRLACGNLNWTTHRPAIGRYMSLSHVKIAGISHVQFDTLIANAPVDVLRKLFTQFELNNLSDRMGFSLIALMPAMTRFQALFLSWAVYFGRIENVPGVGDVVTMPAPGRRWHIEQVIRASSVTLDKILSEAAARFGYERMGEFVRFRAEMLQPAHDWMRYGDGDGIIYKRPEHVEDLLYGAAAGEYD